MFTAVGVAVTSGSGRLPVQLNDGWAQSSLFCCPRLNDSFVSRTGPGPLVAKVREGSRAAVPTAAPATAAAGGKQTSGLRFTVDQRGRSPLAKAASGGVIRLGVGRCFRQASRPR